MEAKLTPSRSLFNKEVVSSDESSESSSDGDTQIRLGKTDWGAQDTVILPGPTTRSPSDHLYHPPAGPGLRPWRSST